MIKIISYMPKQLSREKFLIILNNNPPTFFRRRDQSRSPWISAHVKPALSTSARYCLKDTVHIMERGRDSRYSRNKRRLAAYVWSARLTCCSRRERAPLMNIAIYEGDVQREVQRANSRMDEGRETRQNTQGRDAPGQRSSANRIYPKTRQQASQWDPPLFDVEQSTKTPLRIRERDGAWTLMYVPV